MTRWIAAGVIGAAALYGLGDGNERTVAPESQLPGAASDTMETTAAHEAGHWAAAREFGIPVSHVEAWPDGNGKTDYAEQYYRDTKRDAYDNAVIDVAGQESQAAWLVRNRGYSLDRALDEAAGNSPSDLRYLSEDAARAGITESQARQRARDIINGHRADIDRIAQRLIERGGSLGEPELERE